MMSSNEQIISSTASLEELRSALIEKQLQYDAVNQSNLSLSECKRGLEEQVSVLQKALDDKEEQFRALEEDRTFLRKNIKKASEHWFERKAKLSESESEIFVDSISRQNSNSSDGNKTPPVSTTDVSLQVNLVSEIIKPNNVSCTPEDFAILSAELGYKTEQLELSEKKCVELNKRLKEFENIIDDQEFIIHGMKDQLDTYFEDNQKMSRKLIDLNKLFQELELIDNTSVNTVNIPDTSSAQAAPLPTDKEFKDMASSVSKTYVKLKDLIYEKKSLVTEIERLQTLNVELQRRVVQQESRLFSVSDAIHKTWLLVSDLKEQHAKIHTAESVLRYELKEKREILHKLREELESSREQWVLIREKNSESEKEWKSMHEELNERRRLAAENKDGQESLSDILKGTTGTDTSNEHSFEPPVDLLMDMGIEYGCIDPDGEASATVIAAVEGEDIHGQRLQDLEDQCSYLYQKLMSSTARSLALASRLSSLHQHYGDMSDEDDDEEDTDEENDNDYHDDETDANFFESDMASPDSDSYDTAYVSEPDAAESGVMGGLSEDDASPTVATRTLDTLPENLECLEDSPEAEEDSCDILSKRLINFLPKKIEILRAENKKLEDKCTALQEEKHKMELNLTMALDSERLIRKQTEESLKHLGKCVDELKLERNGKIAEVENELRKKVEKLDQQEATAEELEEKLEDLTLKFEERGTLLQLTNDQLAQKELTIAEMKKALEEAKASQVKEAEKRSTSTKSDFEKENIISSLRNFLRSSLQKEEICIEIQGVLDEEISQKSVKPKTRGLETSDDELKDDLLEEDLSTEELPSSEELASRSPTVLPICTAQQLMSTEHNQEIWLQPLESAILPIELESGNALCWSIQAYPKLTWLTLIQHPDKPCSSVDTSSQAKLVMKRTKLSTDISPVHGTLLAKLAGVYTFLFDNKTAKYTSRKIICKFWFKKEDDNTDSEVQILTTRVTEGEEKEDKNEVTNNTSKTSTTETTPQSHVLNPINSGTISSSVSENNAETDDRPERVINGSSSGT